MGASAFGSRHRSLGYRALRQQPLIILDRGPVTLTRGLLQPLPIRDVDLAAPQLQQPGFLERPKHDGDGGSPHAQHDGHELLRQPHVFRAHSILRGQ